MHSDGSRQASRMTIRTADGRAARPETEVLRSTGWARFGRRVRVRHVVGVMGIGVALPFFVWLPLGWLDSVPSMVDVFGMMGLRYPASMTIGGLLVGAICFYDA